MRHGCSPWGRDQTTFQEGAACLRAVPLDCPRRVELGSREQVWRIHGNRLRFMAAKRENSLESVNDLSHCGAMTYGFHGMHGKSGIRWQRVCVTFATNKRRISVSLPGAFVAGRYSHFRSQSEGNLWEFACFGGVSDSIKLLHTSRQSMPPMAPDRDKRIWRNSPDEVKIMGRPG